MSSDDRGDKPSNGSVGTGAKQRPRKPETRSGVALDPGLITVPADSSDLDSSNGESHSNGDVNGESHAELNGESHAASNGDVTSEMHVAPVEPPPSPPAKRAKKPTPRAVVVQDPTPSPVLDSSVVTAEPEPSVLPEPSGLPRTSDPEVVPEIAKARSRRPALGAMWKRQAEPPPAPLPPPPTSHLSPLPPLPPTELHEVVAPVQRGPQPTALPAPTRFVPVAVPTDPSSERSRPGFEAPRRDVDDDELEFATIPTVKRSVRSAPAATRRRPRIRRVTRVIRHVDPWSVFKVALGFCAVLYGVCLTAGVLLWNVAYTTGTIDNVERFFESFGWSSFEFKGGELYHNAWIAGLFAAVGLTGAIVLAATLFNLMTDLVGGVRVTVLEEEVVERDPALKRQLVPGRRAHPAPTVDPYDPDAVDPGEMPVRVEPARDALR